MTQFRVNFIGTSRLKDNIETCLQNIYIWLLRHSECFCQLTLHTAIKVYNSTYTKLNYSYSTPSFGLLLIFKIIQMSCWFYCIMTNLETPFTKRTKWTQWYIIIYILIYYDCISYFKLMGFDVNLFHLCLPFIHQF